MRQIDDIERKIISLLQQDGRIQFQKMAEIIGTTDMTVRRKFRSLIKDKIIKINANSNPYDIGFSCPVIIGIKAEQEKDEHVVTQLSALPEVQFIAITTGPYEIIIHAAVESNQNLHAFLTTVGSIDGVKSTHSFLMLKIFEKNWNIADYTKQQHSESNNSRVKKKDN